MVLKADQAYWASEIPRPLSPSDEDVKIFKGHLVTGTTLLLGCTRKLIPLSDKQMDIDPWYKADTVIVQDWVTNTVYYDNIIGDGMLNYTKEIADRVLDMGSKYCNVFIARTFTRKLDIMRIAAYFPKAEDFAIYPDQVIPFVDYAFYIWRFENGRN
jgi:hypothetical protein